MMAKLGFLEGGNATRAEIESRLGSPNTIYERGRLVTYSIWEYEGRLTTDYSRLATRSYTLVIEYGPDGSVARRSLVRRVK